MLVTSLRARSGDVALSNGYVASFSMQYTHVELKLDGDKARFENLRSRITMQFTKGKKEDPNKNLVRYLRLLDPKYVHMCPIALLMIHALRHGLVDGTTIQEVLGNAAKEPRRMIIWMFPKYPIVASIRPLPSYRLDLAKPAGILQQTESINQMALVSNFLGRVSVHAIRRRAAQDVSQLPSSNENAGFTSNEVRQFLGHTDTNLRSGVTEAYVGAPSKEFYNDRAQNEHVDPWSSGCSQASAFDFVKAAVTPEELIAWQEEYEPSETNQVSRNARNRAHKGVRAQRQKDFQAPADPELSPSGTPTPQLLNEPKLTNEPLDENIDPRLYDPELLNNLQSDDKAVIGICQHYPSPRPETKIRNMRQCGTC